jgi:hypothetical protein
VNPATLEDSHFVTRASASQAERLLVLDALFAVF